MTTPYARTEREAIAADLRKRIRVLEGITPPADPGPPPGPTDYGFVYLKWTPRIGLNAAGTAPTGYTATGIGVASVAGAAGLVFVHSTLVFTMGGGFSGGSSGIDWNFDFHPDYPRQATVLGGPRQTHFGYGCGVDASASLRQDLWPEEVNSSLHTIFQAATQGNVIVRSTIPWTWASGDILEITADYWSPGP